MASQNNNINKQGLAAWQGFSLNAGATPDHVNKNKIVKSSTPSRRTHSSRSSRHTSISSISSEGTSRKERGTRMTDSFILFWGSALSNWNQGKRFSGARAMDLLITQLDKLTPAVRYPGRHRFATQFMRTHDFICGEQFMMACKAWLFETELYTLAKSEWQKLPSGEYAAIRRRLTLPTQPTDLAEKAMWNSSLARILRERNPRDHKDIGRHVPNFSEETWSRANMAIVISGSVARAEADEDLGRFYKGNKHGKRRFVEGNPYDRIWGVGIHWGARDIEDERRWKGQNLLGRCHDQACRLYNDRLREEEQGRRQMNWMTADLEGETEMAAHKGVRW